jgi:uncharacterized membrane-anchored protein
MCARPLIADGQDNDSNTPSIVWNKGPYTAKLGIVAEIQIPKGYAFTDAAGARRFMELNHNPADDDDIGLIVPIPQDNDSGRSNTNWYLLFEFNEMGYVSDSEKTTLDADKILDSLKKNTEEQNVYRQKKGWSAYHVDGWQTAPFYDEITHNLTWSIIGRSDDPKEGQSVNYSTRILGRRGAMSVDLVLDPTDLSSVLPLSEQVMSTFHFTEGSRYTDFVKGDKVATYGLTALIVGGATAAAIKSGLFAKLIAAMAALWKLIIVGLVAVGAAIKRFFTNIKKKISGEIEAPKVPEPPQESSESHNISSDHDQR